MKAIIYTEYGSADVLHLADVPKPTPQENEVLIKIHATTVTTGDVNMRGFTFVPPGFGPMPRLMFGLRAPKKQILGVELAGEIESVGSAVTRFKPGDQVFGINSSSVGAYAEYVCWPETAPLVHKPSSLSYDEAAAIPFGAGTALPFVRNKANVQPGHKVLVVGASGGVGNYIVQLAKYYGAEVTGVCSTKNVHLVKSLGADHIIDYTQEDYTERGETYDMIFDTVVGKTSFARAKKALKPNGLYLTIAGGPKELFQAMWTPMRGGKKVVASPVNENADDLRFLAELAEAGHIKAFIDRCYPLEQTAEAHRYVDTGRKRGNVVINLSHLHAQGA